MNAFLMDSRNFIHTSQGLLATLKELAAVFSRNAEHCAQLLESVAVLQLEVVTEVVTVDGRAT